MRKDSKNTLRALALGCAVAAAGTAASLYASPANAQQTVAARAVIDTVPTKDTMRPKPDTTKPTPPTPAPTMPTLPTKPDTTKVPHDTMPATPVAKP